MKNSLTSKVGRVAVYACIFALVTAFGLWSWNTLSVLFNGPQAEYKHIIAALSLLAIVKLFLFNHTSRDLSITQ